eukprot:scaffold2022_cov261-Pinguiococcus_pyrenoidosus.AAC.5
MWRSDGTSIEGMFHRGQVYGDAILTYPSGRWRAATFQGGEHKMWYVGWAACGSWLDRTS